MHPPLSMILFTTLVGAAQGLLIALVGADVAAAVGLAALPAGLRHAGAAVVLGLGTIGLVAATFHLGRPLRAWRSAAMWRTSWLSREVIVLPLFLALVFGWAASFALQAERVSFVLGLAAAALAIVLYVCTGMIYGAVKAIREWATPLTPTNFLLLGAASGLLLAAALAAALAPALASPFAAGALVLTLAGAATRGFTLWRNLGLAPKTTLQSAIGVRHNRIVQISQGAMGGSFNTREFFHGQSPSVVRVMRWTAGLLGFALPALVLATGVRAGSALGAAALLQIVGLLAERWSFFAEANHPQNLYYQRVG